MSTPSQEWSAKITAWQHSGMTLAGWCRENSENYHRVLYWRKRLAAPDPGKFGGQARISDILPSVLLLNVRKSCLTPLDPAESRSASTGIRSVL